LKELCKLLFLSAKNQDAQLQTISWSSLHKCTLGFIDTKILVVDVLEWCTSLLRYIINCSLYHMGANLFFQDALGLSMEIPL
jgi:hypothetical protein